MKDLVKGEYLAPEAEVVTMGTEKMVLQITSLTIPTGDPSSIEDSIEAPEIDW